MPPFPFQLDPQSTRPATLLAAGFFLWSSERTKVPIPVVTYAPQFQCNSETPSDVYGSKSSFFEAGISSQFRAPDWLPNLCPLSAAGSHPPPDVGISKLQCGRAVQGTN